MKDNFLTDSFITAGPAASQLRNYAHFSLLPILLVLEVLSSVKTLEPVEIFGRE